MHAVFGDFGPDLLHCCTSGGLKNRFSSGFHGVTDGGWADSWEQLEQPYLAIVAWKCDWWPTQPAAEGDDWLELPPTEICILSASRTVSKINVDAAHFFFIETIELFLTFLSTWMSDFELDIAQNQFGYTLEGFGLLYLLLSPWRGLDNLPAFCSKLHVQFICRKDLYQITFAIISVLELLGNHYFFFLLLSNFRNEKLIL